MYTVSEVQTRIVDLVSPTAAQTVDVVDAYGQILANTVVSPTNLPRWDYSAVDGFGIRHDNAMTSPAMFTIADVKKAGDAINPRWRLAVGQCVQIMTGTPIPNGVDTVIMREDVERIGNTIQVSKRIERGSNIRLTGEDVKPGEIIGNIGDVISPARLNLLLACGFARVPVFSAPKIAVLASGDELCSVGKKPSSAQIIDSNSYAVAALLRAQDANVTHLGIARDTLADHLHRLRDIGNYNLVVTIGGVSVGDFDVMPQALRELGAEILVHGVKLRPGKPFLLAQLNKTLVMGLPGNPVSSLVCTELFAVPAARAMHGIKRAFNEPIRARIEIASPYRKKGDFAHYLRAVLRYDNGVPIASVFANQGSGQVLPLAQSNVLCIVASECEILHPGDWAMCLPLLVDNFPSR